LNQGPLESNKLLDCRRDELCCGNVGQNQLRDFGLRVAFHWRDRLCVPDAEVARSGHFN